MRLLHDVDAWCLVVYCGFGVLFVFLRFCLVGIMCCLGWFVVSGCLLLVYFGGFVGLLFGLLVIGV